MEAAAPATPSLHPYLRALRNLFFLSILEAPAAFILFGAGVILVWINVFLWFLGYVANIIKTLYRIHVLSKTVAQQWQLQIVTWLQTVGLPLLFSDLGIDIGIDLPQRDLSLLDLSKLGLPKIELPKLALPQLELLKLDVPKVDIPRFQVPQLDVPEIDLPEFELPQLQLPAMPMPLPTLQDELPELKFPGPQNLQCELLDIDPLQASSSLDDVRTLVEMKFGEVQDLLKEVQRKLSLKPTEAPGVLNVANAVTLSEATEGLSVLNDAPTAAPETAAEVSVDTAPMADSVLAPLTRVKMRSLRVPKPQTEDPGNSEADASIREAIESLADAAAATLAVPKPSAQIKKPTAAAPPAGDTTEPPVDAPKPVIEVKQAPVFAAKQPATNANPVKAAVPVKTEAPTPGTAARPSTPAVPTVATPKAAAPAQIPALKLPNFQDAIQSAASAKQPPVSR